MSDTLTIRPSDLNKRSDKNAESIAQMVRNAVTNRVNDGGGRLPKRLEDSVLELALYAKNELKYKPDVIKRNSITIEIGSANSNKLIDAMQELLEYKDSKNSGLSNTKEHNCNSLDHGGPQSQACWSAKQAQVEQVANTAAENHHNKLQDMSHRK